MRRSRSRLLFASACLALAAAGCKSQQTQAPVNQAAPDDRTQKALEASERDKRALEEEVQRLSQQLAAKNREIAQWQKQAQAYEATSSRLQKELEEYVRQTPGTSVLQGGVRFEEQLMFDAGKAELKSGGKAALDRLAELMKGKDADLRVEGHTDSDPIQKSSVTWKSKENFELGAYRALSVVTYLKSRGVPADRMHLASHGEYKPIAPNDTKENKAKNRRVEVYLFDKG